MKETLILKMDEMIEGCTAGLKEDIKRLVRIKSVQSEPLPEAPFGSGPRAVLDEFIRMAERRGLWCTDYGVGVVSAARREGKIDLGIWLHADVVPEGEGWRFDPYGATEYKDCIIGRGATDNKGQLAAVLGLFKIFQELNVSLDYNPAIFVGSNEETGMQDIKDFLQDNEAPSLSLVPDASFPVGYGGKGSATITLRSRRPMQSCVFTAGLPDAPGKATARLGKEELTAFSPPRHGASPDPNGNMITLLATRLLEEKRVCDEDRGLLAFLRDVSSDIYGGVLGIKTEHPVLGELTVFSKSVENVGGHCVLTLNIRYPLGITFEKIVAGIAAASDAAGFAVTGAKNSVPPYLRDGESELVKGLCAIANEVTGKERAPYTLRGGTYAHLLPGAYPFGMEGCLPPEDFPKGRGGAHGIDEAVSLTRLKRAMKIYARALLWLNETTW